jgi:DNA-binding NtrC family response regulator
MGETRPRVLIIEDNALVARSLKLMLRAHAPIMVDSLSTLRRVLPTVPAGVAVLSDLGLGDGGADEVLELFTAQRPELLRRFFWMSGGGVMLDRYQDTIDKSDRPLVLKPFSPLDLRALVEGALADEDNEDDGES